MIHSKYLTIDANVVMLLHQMISVVFVCASVQFLTRSEGQTRQTQSYSGKLNV